mgnify:CR=1 FL=1
MERGRGGLAASSEEGDRGRWEWGHHAQAIWGKGGGAKEGLVQVGEGHDGAAKRGLAHQPACTATSGRGVGYGDNKIGEEGGWSEEKKDWGVRSRSAGIEEQERNHRMGYDPGWEGEERRHRLSVMDFSLFRTEQQGDAGADLGEFSATRLP